MCYDEYLKKGWPIASGSVEGACKNLIKGSHGAIWHALDTRYGRGHAPLRAIYLSGDFEEYWDYHVLQDQLRLYPGELVPVVVK